MFLCVKVFRQNTVSVANRRAWSENETSGVIKLHFVKKILFSFFHVFVGPLADWLLMLVLLTSLCVCLYIFDPLGRHSLFPFLLVVQNMWTYLCFSPSAIIMPDLPQSWSLKQQIWAHMDWQLSLTRSQCPLLKRSIKRQQCETANFLVWGSTWKGGPSGLCQAPN